MKQKTKKLIVNILIDTLALALVVFVTALIVYTVATVDQSQPLINVEYYYE